MTYVKEPGSYSGIFGHFLQILGFGALGSNAEAYPVRQRVDSPSCMALTARVAKAL